MNFIVIIPARFASTRLIGKPLQQMMGKPLIEHVYQRAIESNSQRVIIATDDQTVFSTAEKFGAEVMMTGSHHVSGTERLAEVVEELELSENEVVVNLQGDEPCMPGKLISQVAGILSDGNIEMATLACPLRNRDDINNPNVVKLVLDRYGYALYFSRAKIPFDRDGELSRIVASNQEVSYLKHIGLYAYRVGFLKKYVMMQESPLEQMEKLEQLRVLWHGKKIKVELASMSIGPGVDTPEELIAAEHWLGQSAS